MPISDLFDYSPFSRFCAAREESNLANIRTVHFSRIAAVPEVPPPPLPSCLSLCLLGVAGEQMIISPAPPPHLFPSLPFSMSQLHLFYSINELAGHL